MPGGVKSNEPGDAGDENRHWPVRHDGAPTGAVLLLNTHACFMLLFLPMTFLMRDSVMKLIKQKCFSFGGSEKLDRIISHPRHGAYKTGTSRFQRF